MGRRPDANSAHYGRRRLDRQPASPTTKGPAGAVRQSLPYLPKFLCEFFPRFSLPIQRGDLLSPANRQEPESEPEKLRERASAVAMPAQTVDRDEPHAPTDQSPPQFPRPSYLRNIASLPAAPIV